MSGVDTNAPERIWLDDERGIGGEANVFDVSDEGVLKYCTEYVRVDLHRALAAEVERLTRERDEARRERDEYQKAYRALLKEGE